MEMDKMKLELPTKFMKSIIAKLITRTVYKKLGYEIDFQLIDMDIETVDGKVRLHADVNVEVESDELMKLIKSI